MRVVVLSDTHVRSGGTTRLTTPTYAALETADVILHCGDIVSAEFFEELRRFAPVHAVLGNNDDPELAAVLPMENLVDLDGVTVVMVHDAGPARGRPGRLRNRFPSGDVIVFGHSHIPVDDVVDGQLQLNPGSPTQRRRQPHRTIGVIDVRDGAVRDHGIRIVDDPAA
jgi:hypothetical protein